MLVLKILIYYNEVEGICMLEGYEEELRKGERKRGRK